MFSIDERIRGLPATRDQVVALHQSLNQPNLAVPGRHAGPSQAFILGLRGAQGYAVFVYLYMPDSAQCAVYVSDQRVVRPEAYEQEESEAHAFVESMGFMMDNLNFRGRPVDEQEFLLKSLPVFQREPPKGGTLSQKSSGPGTQVSSIGKLFAAFCLALLVGASGCVKNVSEKDREEAGIHYDLGVQSQVEDPQTAMREFERALELNPEMPEALHARGVLLHVVFRRLDEAQASYRKALELQPKFSDAHTNLGNLYLDEKRYDEAITEYEAALNDMMYRTPFIAQANLGWALYKKGEVGKAVGQLKASVTQNPKFCLGFKNLGVISDETGQTEEGCKYFGKYREACPNEGDAHRREGVCLAKLGKRSEAKASFEQCIGKGSDVLKDECSRLKEQLGQ